VNPDALHAAVGYLCREWGEHGYRVTELRSIGWSGAGAIGVRHSDGSEFWIATDRYSCHLVAGDTFEAVVSGLSELVHPTG
jgi:hypothetical protein